MPRTAKDTSAPASKSKANASANLEFEAKVGLAADSRRVAETAEGNLRNNSAKQPMMGNIVNDAMVAIERDNPRLPTTIRVSSKLVRVFVP